MRFGVCTSADRLEEVAAAGYDYLEASASALAAMSEEEFAQCAELAARAPIRVEAVNILFPSHFSLYDTPRAELAAHLELALSRSARLGARIAVFGSGKARRKPEELAFAEAYHTLMEVLRLAGDTAGKYGITIAVEPLNCTETNLIRSVAEGALVACGANHPHVGLLADGYHMFHDDEPMEHIQIAGALVHTHVALRDGRVYPTSSDALLERFFEALRAIGYGARMSVEGKTEDFAADAPKALATLRALANRT